MVVSCWGVGFSNGHFGRLIGGELELPASEVGLFEFIGQHVETC